MHRDRCNRKLAFMMDEYQRRRLITSLSVHPCHRTNMNVALVIPMPFVLIKDHYYYDAMLLNLPSLPPIHHDPYPNGLDGDSMIHLMQLSIMADIFYHRLEFVSTMTINIHRPYTFDHAYGIFSDCTYEDGIQSAAQAKCGNTFLRKKRRLNPIGGWGFTVCTSWDPKEDSSVLLLVSARWALSELLCVAFANSSRSLAPVVQQVRYFSSSSSGLSFSGAE